MTIQPITDAVICPGCNQPARLLTAAEHYGSDRFKNHVYACKACDTLVGTHPGTTRPLGTMAGKALRRARMAAHAAFDPIWRGEGALLSRPDAYRSLKAATGVQHIGESNADECRRVI